MVLRLEEWKEMLNTLKIITKFSNLFEQIKEIIKDKDLNTYKKWGEKNFDLREEFFLVTYNRLILPSSLLDIAAACCSLAIVKCLTDERKTDVNLTDLTYYAAIGNNLEVIKYFTDEKGIDVNIKDNVGNTPLRWAAMSGSLEVVQYLMDKGADINVQDNVGSTLLHWAAMSNSLEVIQYLIYEKKIDVNTRDEDYSTPLHWAAGNGNLETVQYLVEKEEADINAKDCFGITPLGWAATDGHLEVVKDLIGDKKADVNLENFTHTTTIRGHLEIIRYLIDERKANVDLKDLISIAAMSNALKVMRYLIDEKEVDVNATNNNGVTALHLAAKGGYLLLVKYLVDKGADVDAQDYYSTTPLDWAARRDHLKVIKYLIDEKKINANLTDIAYRVAEEGYLEAVKYFVDEKEVDVDLTRLTHGAATHGHLEVVKYFIDEKGVDVNAQDINGKTSLHQAAVSGCLEVVEYLIDKGADVNAQDNDGKIPLYFADYGGNADLVRLLLDKEADLDLQDSNGKTVLYNTLHLGGRYYGTGCAKLLIVYKIKFQGSNTEKPEYLKNPDTSIKRRMSEYWNECVKEIKKMEQKEIDNDVTLYAILASKNNKLTSYIRKESIRSKLEEFDYKSEFPIYGNDLERQFKIGRDRVSALIVGEKIVKHFGNVGEGPFNLKIAEYLSNEHMKNLRKAAIQAMNEEIPQSLDNIDVANLKESVKGVS